VLPVDVAEQELPAQIQRRQGDSFRERGETKCRKKREVRPRRILAMFERADAWQALLDSGEVVNRSALARRFGVSAMRVTQVLALLKLDQRVRDAIFALPAGTKDRYVGNATILRAVAASVSWPPALCRRAHHSSRRPLVNLATTRCRSAS
jgi:hypothetical protein